MSESTSSTPEAGVAKQHDTADSSSELMPLTAHEEEPAVEKTRAEIIAEKLATLQQFSYATAEPPENDETGASVYLAVCNRIHESSYMQFPTSGVARDLRMDRETLDLSHAGLGRKGCQALAAALRVNTTASSLVLTGNHITPSAALPVVRAIRESHPLTSVDLSVNDLGKAEVVTMAEPSVRGGAVINELIAHGSTVVSLSLRSTQLTDSDLGCFADTLAENITLHSLDLGDNKLGPAAATLLASVLSRNSDMRTINLEWNQFGPFGCRQLLADGFLQNNTIKSFNLSFCGLDDLSASLIARIIGENATEEIIIANNRIGPSGAALIAKAFSPSSSLVTLVMDGNNIGDTGCTTLLAAAANCGDSSNGTLRLLSLRHCGCSVEVEEKYRGAAADSAKTVLQVSEGYGNMVFS